MTIDKCVYGSHKKKSCSKKLRKYWKKNEKEKKNGILKKTRILKYLKCQWEEMIHINVNW